MSAVVFSHVSKIEKSTKTNNRDNTKKYQLQYHDYPPGDVLRLLGTVAGLVGVFPHVPKHKINGKT